jgi:CBS domain-containing protein
MLDKTVGETMTTDVLTFAPTDNVQDAMQRLVERGLDAGPVVDANGVVVGMLSASDLIVQGSRLHFPAVVNFLGVNIELSTPKEWRINEEVEKLLGMFVSDVMHKKVVTIRPEATLQDAATLMHDKDVSRLPVVDDDGRLVGIIARTDILRALVAQR